MRRSEFSKERFRAGYRAALADVGLLEEHLDLHPQVLLDGVEVDVEMASLLEVLWRLGLETQFSCQGDPERYIRHQATSSVHDAHIVFADLGVAIRFMRRTIDLLGYVPFKDGWMELTPMQAYGGEGPVRGRVGWPPVLHDEIRRLWIDHSRRVLSDPVKGSERE